MENRPEKPIGFSSGSCTPFERGIKRQGLLAALPYLSNPAVFSMLNRN